MKPTFIQQDPSIERRRRLAEHMMANRKTGPVRTGMEGAARIAEQLVAGYQLGKARKDQAAWDEAARKDLARIMSDYQNDVRPLSQHPGTADIATQIQLSQMEADKAAEAAKAARKTDLEDYIFKKQVDQRYPGQQKGTTAMQNAAALGYQPGTPEYIEYIRSTTKKGPLVSVGGDNYSPLQEELAKTNAKDYTKWRADAMAAGKMEPYLAQMEAISEMFETGKTEKALATLGQWMGTDAGAALQAFKASQVPIMLQMAESVSGPMTEKEWDMLREALPNFGSDPRANKIVLNLIRKGIDGTRRNFEEAQAYIRNNKGSLQGYMPHYARRAEGGREDGNKPPTQAEIEAEIKRRGLK